MNSDSSFLLPPYYTYWAEGGRKRVQSPTGATRLLYEYINQAHTVYQRYFEVRSLAGGMQVRTSLVTDFIVTLLSPH